MSKSRPLPIISDQKVIKALQRAGFLYAPKRGKGSHIAMVKQENGRTFLVIVPKRRDIPRGTLSSILDQSGLSKDQFMDLL